MSAILMATSHSPLMGLNDPDASVVGDVASAHHDARAFIDAFRPELAIVFAPDHYNGFFYDVMPPFCIGMAATSIGDYGLPAGPVRTERDAARRILAGVHAQGVDVAVSEDMKVDHGLVQPLMLMFDGLDRIPIVPIFVNCVAEPLVPATRIAALGSAVGVAARQLGRRVVILASGGLSHDPPVPTLVDAAPAMRDRLLARTVATPADRARREDGTLSAAKLFAEGVSPLRELNPDWDRSLMNSLATGEVDAVAAMPNDWFVAEGGHSAHEVRTWIAAYAAMATYGPYEVTTSFYRPIPEWLAGFGVTTARTVDSTPAGVAR